MESGFSRRFCTSAHISDYVKVARRAVVAQLGVIGKRRTACKNRPDDRNALAVCNAIRLNLD